MHRRVVPLLVAVCALFAFAKREGPANIFGSRLVREVRYTKFNMTNLNPSSIEAVNAGLRSVRNKQMLNFQINVNGTFPMFHGKFSIFKCKEYYIDCVNVISYNITNGCLKSEVFMRYLNMVNEMENKKICPLHGIYAIDNFTINAEQFGTMFSYPTEKWWEYYWRIRTKIYDQNYSELIVSLCDFYIVQFRSHYHSPF